jgi:hypothetical protein
MITGNTEMDRDMDNLYGKSAKQAPALHAA